LIDAIEIGTGKAMGLIISDAVQTSAPGAISLSSSVALGSITGQVWASDYAPGGGGAAGGGLIRSETLIRRM
jgi:hypothetical protein